MMLFQFTLTDVLGLGLLIFGDIWGLYSFYLLVRRKDLRLTGLVILCTAIIGVSLVIYLSASTAVRQAYIDLDLRALFNTFGLVALAVLLAGIVAYSIYRIAMRLSTQQATPWR